jgi:hypothetical protein
MTLVVMMCAHVCVGAVRGIKVCADAGMPATVRCGAVRAWAWGAWAALGWVGLDWDCARNRDTYRCGSAGLAAGTACLGYVRREKDERIRKIRRAKKQV